MVEALETCNYFGIYLSPYLTCLECNAINMINANILLSVKTTLDRHGGASLQNPQALPACVGCHRTRGLVLGARNLQKEINQNQSALQIYLKARENAALLLQRLYRGHRTRQELNRIEKIAQDKIKRDRQAATTIQSYIRGTIGRRTIMVNSALRLIQDACPVVRRQITMNLYPIGARKISWYDSEALEAIYVDYRRYLSSIGHTIPLGMMESNLIEIARRILQYEDEMARRIQLKWRFNKCRQVIRTVMLYRARLQEYRWRNALVIQRSVRIYLNIRRCRQVRNQRAADRSKESYLKEQTSRHLNLQNVQVRKDLLRSYQKVRKEAHALSCIGRIPFANSVQTYLNSSHDTTHLNRSISRFRQLKPIDTIV